MMGQTILHLYHGTTHYFETPDLHYARPWQDFGKGFYLTTNFAQAANWAVRHIPVSRVPSYGYIYEYTFDMADKRFLSCLELLEY